MWRFQQHQHQDRLPSTSRSSGRKSINKIVSNKISKYSSTYDDKFNWLDLENLTNKNTHHKFNQDASKRKIFDTSHLSLPTVPSALTPSTIESLLSDYEPKLYLSSANEGETSFPVIF